MQNDNLKRSLQKEGISNELYTESYINIKEANIQYQKGYFDTLREHVVSHHKPPKNSISEFVYKDQPEELLQFILNLEDKEDINMTDLTGATHSWTALYWGVKLRRLECISILLTHGADINIVIHDSNECCGTVLDLITLRDDKEIELILRKYAEQQDLAFGQSYKPIRTKIRGKTATAFNFKSF